MGHFMWPFFMFISINTYMKNRLYLDYNSTAPLASSVKSYLISGQFLEANASSTHSSGVEALKQVDYSIDSIRNHFKNNSNFDLFFHSGASEGISTFFNLKPTDIMVFFESDHPAVHAIATINEKKGTTIIKMPILENGYFDEEKVVQELAPYQGKEIYLNYTFVHNETGIVWPLAEAEKLKEKTGCKVHVDCAQVVGKTEQWEELNSQLDFYTFSSHKFGGLKGCGFSFVHKEFNYRPLIPGGGQQAGLRGGTLNILGIKTTALALDDAIQNQNFNSSLLLRDRIEQHFEKALENLGFVVLGKELRAVNTSLLCLKKQKGDFLQIKFDMEGVDLSYGSACSAGSLKGSDTMRALGKKEFANQVIRISFGPNDYQNSDVIIKKLDKVFQTLK